MSVLREQIEQEGWVLVPGLLSRETVADLLRAAEVLEQGASHLTRDTVVRGVGYEVQSASGRKKEEAVAPGVLRKITFPSKAQWPFTQLRANARLLATLEEAGLSNPRCLVDHLNLKPARVGTGFPFHQDAQFLVGKTQGRLERQGGLNLIIALDPCDAENGAFEVLGRTHLGPLVDFPYDMVNMNEGLFDETHRALCPMRPGDAVFFHPRLAHGSGPNRSERPRRVVAMWFAGGSPAT
jgi:ectoine hydroxylase-related dioxygenase (phytanoyl-CoA dioxygenase family)